MKTTSQQPAGSEQSHSELLILPDGRILVHNLTQTMAEVLHELNQSEEVIHPRAKAKLDLQNLRPIVA